MFRFYFAAYGQKCGCRSANLWFLGCSFDLLWKIRFLGCPFDLLPAHVHIEGIPPRFPGQKRARWLRILSHSNFSRFVDLLISQHCFVNQSNNSTTNEIVCFTNSFVAISLHILIVQAVIGSRSQLGSPQEVSATRFLSIFSEEHTSSKPQNWSSQGFGYNIL